MTSPPEPAAVNAAGELELGLEPRDGIVGDRIDGVGGYHVRVMATCDRCGWAVEATWNGIGFPRCEVCGQGALLAGFGIYANEPPAPKEAPV